jgi:trk system potassium uptake protein TrkA
MAKKQVIVIGLGRFGSNVARTLYRMGHDVLAVDLDERLVQEVMADVTYAVKADATNEAVLRELGVLNFDSAVVAVGSDIEANVMCTVLLKGLGVPYIAARARTLLHGKALERVGADRVIYPEREMGSRVARTLFNPDVLEYMELAAGFGISKMKAPPALEGLTLKEAGLSGTRDKYSLSILAVRRGKDLILLPSEEERLRSGDQLILANKDDMLDRLYQARSTAPARA